MKLRAIGQKHFFLGSDRVDHGHNLRSFGLKSMKWSVDELSDIRVLVGELLRDAGLRSFVFDIEQDEANWIISVDFQHRDDWQTIDLRVDKDVLRDCLQHPESRQILCSAWQQKFSRLD